MEKNGFVLVFIILIISIILVLTACQSNQTIMTYNTLKYFNTSVDGYFIVNKSDSNTADSNWQEILTELERINTTISVYDSNSDINKFNNSNGDEWIQISKDSYDIFKIAIEAFNKTNGAYNPAVYLLSDLWGFTDRFSNKNYKATKIYDRQDFKNNLPDEKYIEAFKSLTNFNDVKILENDGVYSIYKPGNSVTLDDITYTMQIDLGGIGKGYASEQITKICNNNNITTNGYINVGTSSIAVLEKADASTWNIKFKHPRKEGAYYLAAKVGTSQIATSGDYEQYYEIGGRRYCHIIDANSGCPINTNIVTTSVILGEYGALADAYATALCVMSKENAIKFIKDNELSAAFIYFDEENNMYEAYMTNDFELIENSYTIKNI